MGSTDRTRRSRVSLESLGGGRMVRRLLWLVSICLAIAASAPARAHHSFAAEFDENATAELKGQIAQVWWNNPHVRYRLTTKAKDGSAEDWELQASSITALSALGWSANTLKAGDVVTVSGQLGREGAKKLYVRSIVRADGSKLATGRDSNSPDPNQVHATRGTYGYGAMRATYPIDITGPWRNKYHWHLTV